jgi:hypothetical protein
MPKLSSMSRKACITFVVLPTTNHTTSQIFASDQVHPIQIVIHPNCTELNFEIFLKRMGKRKESMSKI